MSEWGDEIIRHKYDPLPDDASRHKKKAKKKRVRSDHKHVYEDVCVDAHSYSIRRGCGRVKLYHRATRCKLCGRLQNARFWAFKDEPPEDMPLYEVEDIIELARMKSLPEDRRAK